MPHQNTARRKRRRAFWRLALGIGVLVLALLAGHQGLQWSRQKQQQHQINRILTLLHLPADHQARFDVLRSFVHAHSNHAADAEFAKLRGDGFAIAKAVADHAAGDRPWPPHLECSTRSNLLAKLYRTLGYRTRIVYIFDTDKRKLRSHTFVDVLDPSAGKWMSQDADHDLYWRATSLGRVSVADLPENLSNIEPCGPHHCGWDLVSDEGYPVSNIRDLVDIVATTDKTSGERTLRYTSRAEPDRIFSFMDRIGSFCEIMPQLCRATRQQAIPGAEH